MYYLSDLREQATPGKKCTSQNQTLTIANTYDKQKNKKAIRTSIVNHRQL